MPKSQTFELGGWSYSVVDVATDVTTICPNPAYLRAITVNTVLSAHVLPIKDDTVTVFSLPASYAAGNNYNCYGTLFKTSLIVDPNDAATGNITVIWRPA